jgi:hypothetical protein
LKLFSVQLALKQFIAVGSIQFVDFQNWRSNSLFKLFSIQFGKALRIFRIALVPQNLSNRIAVERKLNLNSKKGPPEAIG